MTEDSNRPDRSAQVLDDFVAYCKAHPTERFWQALRNWSDWNFIFVAAHPDGKRTDTFYWEGKGPNVHRHL